MASILDRYGIKEVADVTFYNINDDGSKGAPVLYLDTLKVSTIEQTAETADARGGKGNPKLVTWDYGKDITVTLEDALFSAKSLSIMFGNGTVKEGNPKIQRTVMARLDKNGNLGEVSVDIYNEQTGGATREKVNIQDFASKNLTVIGVFDEYSKPIDDLGGNTYNGDPNARVFITYEVAVSNNREIIVSSDTFPGTYYVTGDTYARSDVTGADQFFQFIIPKAKVTSENTITLEAEGDPSVFNMNLTVLRPEDGEMMKLVQYELADYSVAALDITGPNVVEAGAKIKLTANKEGVNWASDNTGVVTVSNGEVTGKAAGIAVITAKLGSGETEEVAEHIVRCVAKTTV